jgi:hypothetical protein
MLDHRDAAEVCDLRDAAEVRDLHDAAEVCSALLAVIYAILASLLKLVISSVLVM